MSVVGKRSPRGERRAQLLIRVALDIRDACAEEAERTGSSMSRVAERWIQRGLEGDDFRAVVREEVEAALTRHLVLRPSHIGENILRSFSCLQRPKP